MGDRAHTDYGSDECVSNEAARSARIATALREEQLPAGVTLRPYHAANFPAIQRLAQAEGWTTFVQRPIET